MSEKVQQVAQAIEQAMVNYRPDKAQCSRDMSVVVASAAIEAMRHIPDEWFSVLVRSFNMRDDEEHRTVARLWYHRMIDEALK